MRRSRSLLVVALIGLLLGTLALAEPSAAAEPAFGLGTVTVGATGDGQCPAGHTCTSFEIAGCPGVSGTRAGFYARSPSPSGSPRGVVVLFSGGGGTAYFAPGVPAQESLVQRLHQDHGFIVIQVRWGFSWTKSASGEQAGPARLACRPATILDYLHDTVYAPLALPEQAGVCGFCWGGGSGGSAQSTYPLSHYGRDVIANGVFPFSGPTHAAIAKGCRRDVRAEETYWYPNGGGIDESYGYESTATNPPCKTHLTSWVDTWNRDSVDTQGSDYHHPNTRVHLILGEGDDTQRPRAHDYVARLTTAGSPMVAFQSVPGMGHALNADGTLVLEDALLWSASHGMHACDNGLDDDDDGLTDLAGPDPGCASGSDNSERGAGLVCDDGADQDGDGRPDAPTDSGCAGPADPDASEQSVLAKCDNGADDDGDGRADYPADPGCASITDGNGTGSPERDSAYACDNGVDDDGDGGIDHAVGGTGDPQCTSPEHASESSSGGGGPQILIGSKTVNEGSPGTTIGCRFDVTLSAPSSQTVTVDYASANDTAVAPSDYTARSGRLSFAPGTTSGSVTVTVIGDDAVEPNEQFLVNLSQPGGGATLGDPQGVCSILNDDVAGGPTISGFTPTSGPVGTSVTINGTNFSDATSVTFNRLGASFVVNSATRITATVPSGATTGKVGVSNPAGTATSASNFTVTTGGGGTISAADASATERDPGQTVAKCQFKVTLSAKPSQQVTVSYATAPGTAVAGGDYTHKSGSVSWAAGTTSLTKTVSVTLTADTVAEPVETFSLTLSNPAGATIADGQAVCTITDDAGG